VGPGSKPVVQAASTIGNAFFVTGTGVTLQNLELKKTDLPNQDLIAVQGGNFTASNNLIYGPDPGMTWNAAGIVSRGFVISAVPNVNLLNNVIHHLRQPAYMSGGAATGGNITGNQVSGTKGWVVEGGNFIFTGNTFGEPQNQSCDIALLASVAPINNATYEPILALSAANDNAFICQQYGPLENGRANAFVDDGSAPGGNGSDNANYNSINAAVAGALTGGTVTVAAGTYNEDVSVTKTLKVFGAGPVGTTIVGQIGGIGSTISITGNNVEISGFTITRAGNNVGQWNDPNLNTAGISVQGTSITGMLIHDNLITGMRTAIDINNSNGHTVRNNVIDNNRTGLIMRNQTDNLTVVENTITNNWTVGALFLDGSGGTNVPVNSAINCSFFNNNISGNWYGGIVDRQSGGSLPAPGTNLKNFSGNWFGTNAPVVTTANSTEPGYAAQIPVIYGGSAVPPGGQPDIAGPASANFDYSPYLNVSTDSNVETTPGRGTYGFQGSFNVLNISATSAQTGGGSKIQEAIDLVTPGGSITVPAGTYPGSVNVNKALSINGTFSTAGGSFATTAAGVVISPGYSPGIITSGNLSFGSGTTVNVELNGVVAGSGYDQFDVTGTVTIAANVTLNPTIGYVPVAGDSYTIINNDGGDAVTGAFAGLPDGTVFSVGANTLRIDYDGGDGNDVVLTNVSLCNSVSIPTNITSLTGGTPVASVNVDNTTGNGLLSADFWVTYDPSVVTYASSVLGPVTAGGVLTVNPSTPGLLKISIFRNTPFTGAGSMVDITFNAIGAPGTSSPISFTQFKFNEGTPCISTSNGLITIISGTITGTVTYGNPIGSPAVRPVSAATLNAVGSVNVSAATNLSGVYSLSGMGSGPYTVTPTKTGGTNGAISGFDSSFIAQYVVGLIPLNGTQQTVADVSGTGGVTSFDAALIARYVVALPGSGSAGNWIFTPANRNYPNVNTNFSAQDYVAYLMGDVTGNWDTSGTTGGSRLAPGQTKPLGVSAGQVSVSPNAEVSVPVHIGNTAGKGIVSYQFEMTYDPAVLTPSNNVARLTGTLSDSMFATVNTETPGTLKVVVFGTLPMNGEGVLLNLRFTAIGAIGTTSELTWDSLLLNEGGLFTETSNGRVTVTEAAPNEVSISGTLLTAIGQGVPNTRVTLTGINGGSRTVLSNGFGYYEFGNVETGQTYTISVEGRRYTFNPVMVSVTGNLAHVDLIAQP
ncbi:MAG: cohesin domain-containing protein, partial [Pyrinomonadaceae bacterium]